MSKCHCITFVTLGATGKAVSGPCHYFVMGGVIGTCVDDEFSEESNFRISEVVMKVKMSGSEAGWIVRISEVLRKTVNHSKLATH